MNQHTRGPWTVGEPLDPLTTHAIRGPINDDGTSALIAGVCMTGFPRRGKLYPSIANTGDEKAIARATTDANAALLAAAPELLAALEKIAKDGPPIEEFAARHHGRSLDSYLEFDNHDDIAYARSCQEGAYLGDIARAAIAKAKGPTP
jgi:hypothetical protein